MIEVNATLFTLLLEACAGLALFFLVALLVAWRRKAGLRRALRELVTRIEADSPERLAAATAALAEAGDQGEAAAAGLHERERAVCQAFIDACARRDGKRVANVYDELVALVDGWREHATVQAPASPAPANADVDVAARDKALRQLAHERDTVVLELAKTRETVDKMMQEYTNMFGDGASHDAGEAEARAPLEIADESGDVEPAAAVEVDVAVESPPAEAPASDVEDAADAEVPEAADEVAVDASDADEQPKPAAAAQDGEAVAHAGDAEQLAAELDEALAADIDAAVEQSQADEFDIALDDEPAPAADEDAPQSPAKAASA